MQNIFIASYLRRYWRLHAVFIFLVLISKVDQIVYFVGPLFYLLQLAVGVAEAMFLTKHLVFQNSIDLFTQSSGGGKSQFVITWSALGSNDKLKYTMWTILVLVFSFSIIAASIAK